MTDIQNVEDKAKETAEDAGSTIKNKAMEVNSVLINAIHKNPYTSIAIAIFLGWAIGKRPK